MRKSKFKIFIFLFAFFAELFAAQIFSANAEETINTPPNPSSEINAGTVKKENPKPKTPAAVKSAPSKPQEPSAPKITEEKPAEKNSSKAETEKQPEKPPENKENEKSLNLPEVSESEIKQTPEINAQELQTNSKKNPAETIAAWLFIAAGIFIIAKVIISNFRIPKNYESQSKSKHAAKRGRVKNKYNIKY